MRKPALITTNIGSFTMGLPAVVAWLWRLDTKVPVSLVFALGFAQTSRNKIHQAILKTQLLRPRLNNKLRVKLQRMDALGHSGWSWKPKTKLWQAQAFRHMFCWFELWESSRDVMRQASQLAICLIFLGVDVKNRVITTNHISAVGRMAWFGQNMTKCNIATIADHKIKTRHYSTYVW